LIDVGKAWFVVAYGHDLLVGEGGRVLPIPLELSGLAVLLGNFFNVFLGFKGGKGVATSLGVFLALAPAAVLVALGVFLASLAVSRYVSLSSILAAVAFPIMVLYTSGLSAMLLLAVVIATVVIVKHRANITRLMNGTENRIGSGTRKEKA
jgi:glycerol-3-phosphate acyltransferase PlsY